MSDATQLLPLYGLTALGAAAFARFLMFAAAGEALWAVACGRGRVRPLRLA